MHDSRLTARESLRLPSSYTGAGGRFTAAMG